MWHKGVIVGLLLLFYLLTGVELGSQHRVHCRIEFNLAVSFQLFLLQNVHLREICMTLSDLI